VIRRAVTAFPAFVGFTRKLISAKSFIEKPYGIIYLKGGDFNDEIIKFKKKVEIFNISEFFEEDFFETKKIIYLPIKVK
jgi:16S rRNA (guanine527-N7)-methyltransferase